MADYIVQEEDGTSKLILEDGSGALLFEGWASSATSRLTASGADASTFNRSGSATSRIATSGWVESNVLVTQVVVEAIVQDNPYAEVTQVVVEAIVPSGVKSRRGTAVSDQVATGVDVVTHNTMTGSATSRITASGWKDNTVARVSQEAIEVLESGASTARVSQEAIEVLLRGFTYQKTGVAVSRITASGTSNHSHKTGSATSNLSAIGVSDVLAGKLGSAVSSLSAAGMHNFHIKSGAAVSSLSASGHLQHEYGKFGAAVLSLSARGLPYFSVTGYATSRVYVSGGDATRFEETGAAISNLSATGKNLDKNGKAVLNLSASGHNVGSSLHVFVTQVATEILETDASAAVVTQVATETLETAVSPYLSATVTQVAIEVLRPRTKFVPQIYRRRVF